MRVVLISDTHENRPQIPDGDLLIHAGDFTYSGDAISVATNVKWFLSHPHRHKVFIAGNHDFAFCRLRVRPPEDSRSIGYYLEDSMIVCEGLRIWGSPYTPPFCNWAFMAPPHEIRKHWALIPEGLDILITHGPPAGILDKPCYSSVSGCGCPDLLKTASQVRPRIHVFGHIHGGYGHTEREGIKFYNASLCNEAYQPVNAPWVIDL